MSQESLSLICAVTHSLEVLDQARTHEWEILDWASPVPVFGSLLGTQVATVGINPSNREFVDGRGVELDGADRRFHSLNSLGLSSWAELDSRQLSQILESYGSYFERRSYAAWFNRLEAVITAAGASFYGAAARSACHVDLVPFATGPKWGSLDPAHRVELMSAGSGVVGRLLRDSEIRLLILNGSTVVREFEGLSRTTFDRHPMPGWSLYHRGSREVPGVGFSGVVTQVAGIHLDREMRVLGFNLNLQSSYGVTRSAASAIRDWVAETGTAVLQ